MRGIVIGYESVKMTGGNKQPWREGGFAFLSFYFLPCFYFLGKIMVGGMRQAVTM
jgi:hypothetical protein